MTHISSKLIVSVPRVVATQNVLSTNAHGPKLSRWTQLYALSLSQAQAKYAEMRRLDAAALDATQALGCASCAQAAAAAAAGCSGGAAAQQQQQGSPQLYEQLHAPSAWPAAEAAGKASCSS